MRPVAIELYEEITVYRQAPARFGIQLDHPAANSVRIELLIPGVIERVGKVNTAAIAADFDHLRRAVQRIVGLLGVSGSTNDTSQVYRSGEPGIEGIRNIILPHLAGSPTSHIQKSVIKRQIDIAHQRRNRFE